jgi:hypothetical protein
MQKVTTIPGLPAKRAAHYRLDDHNGIPFDPPRFARVIYIPQESKPDRAVIEAQAFEIDANGVLVANPATGAASRTPGTLHTISMSGVGDTHTLNPGWIRVVGTHNPGQPNTLPEGTDIVTALPPTGTEGQTVFFVDHLYRWDIGMVELVMRGKAQELGGLLFNADASLSFEL